MAKLETPLNVSIVPAGMWGSALGLKAFENGHNVCFYLRNLDKASEFAKSRRHPNFQNQSLKFPNSIKVTSNLEEAVTNAQIVVLAPPARYMRDLMTSVGKYSRDDTVFLSASKGLDLETRQVMSEVICTHIPSAKDRTAVISGPNFASEIAEGKFAATEIAIPNLEDEYIRRLLVKAFCSNIFLTHIHDDLTGLQIGAAYKNPIALANGILAGLNQPEIGENALAYLPASGVAEAYQLAQRLGGKPETFSLQRAVMADVIVSCSKTSRNFAAGLKIGQGVSVKELLESGQTIEGIYSAPALYQIAQEVGLHTPILEGVTRIICGEDPRRVVLESVISAKRLIQNF